MAQLAFLWSIPAGASINWGATAMMYGSALSAASSIQQGRVAQATAKSQEAMSQYNAKIMEREAEAIRQKGAFDQKRQAKEAERIKSRMRAKMAASGALQGTGTELLIEGEQAAELELDNLLIGYEAEVEARRRESQAALDRAQGRIYRRKGKAARTAGLTGAGTSLLTGFASYYGY